MAGMGMDVVGVGGLLETIDDINDSLGSPDYVVGTSVQYAIYLETGTSKMPSYPFMTPAVKKVMREQGDQIAAEADSVEEVVKGIAFAIEKEAKNYASTGVAPGPDEISGNLKGSITARKL